MSVKTELKELTLRGGGVLTPESIVRFAKSHPRSALHKRFNWSIHKAAWAHWLEQARTIIQVHVEIMDVGNGRPRSARAYVSVRTSKNRGARAYRTTRSVLSHKETRRQLILDQLKLIRGILASYPLPELKPILSAVAKIENQFVASKAA